MLRLVDYIYLRNIISKKSAFFLQDGGLNHVFQTDNFIINSYLYVALLGQAGYDRVKQFDQRGLLSKANLSLTPH